MWELDHKEGWAMKKWCFWTVVLEKTLESPLDSKIKPVNPIGNQPWIFIVRTNAEASVLWPPDGKSIHWKRSWCWERLREEREGRDRAYGGVGWHHWLNGHESEQTLGDCEGQGKTGCCSPWSHKEYDMTEWLHNNKSRWDTLEADSWREMKKTNPESSNDLPQAKKVVCGTEWPKNLIEMGLVLFLHCHCASSQAGWNTLN